MAVSTGRPALTARVATLGFVPVAVSSGAEVQRPPAAVIGNLSTSAGTRFVIPPCTGNSTRDWQSGERCPAAPDAPGSPE